MTQINKNSEIESIINSSEFVVLYFWANWCGPCKTFFPILSKIVSENPKIFLKKINVDEEGELLSRFDIRSIPTLILFKNQVHVDTIVGAGSEAKIREDLLKYI